MTAPRVYEIHSGDGFRDATFRGVRDINELPELAARPGARLKARWMSKDGATGDFVYCDGYFLCSQRAVDTIGPLLRAHARLTPVELGKRDWYLIMLTIEAPDFPHARTPLFFVTEEPDRYYCMDPSPDPNWDFFTEVRKNDLRGLRVIPWWPPTKEASFRLGPPPPAPPPPTGWTEGALVPVSRATSDDWIGAGVLALPSGRLAYADAGWVVQKRMRGEIELPAGRYAVELRRGADEDGCDRVAGLRLVHAGLANAPAPGKKLAMLEIDTATAAFADAAALDGVPAKHRKHLAHFAAYANDDEGWAVLRSVAVPEAVVVICETGQGDGAYPVRELTVRGKRAGIEVEFL